MSVHYKYVVIHPMLQRNHGDDVHASIAELQGDNAQIRFHLGEHQAQLDKKGLVSHLSLSLSVWGIE